MEDFSPRMLCMSLLGLSAASGQMEDVKMLKVSSEKPFRAFQELDGTLEKLKVVVEDRLEELSHRDFATVMSRDALSRCTN